MFQLRNGGFSVRDQMPFDYVSDMKAKKISNLKLLWLSGCGIRYVLMN